MNHCVISDNNIHLNIKYKTKRHDMVLLNHQKIQFFTRNVHLSMHQLLFHLIIHIKFQIYPKQENQTTASLSLAR